MRTLLTNNHLSQFIKTRLMAKTDYAYRSDHLTFVAQNHLLMNPNTTPDRSLQEKERRKKMNLRRIHLTIIFILTAISITTLILYVQADQARKEALLAQKYAEFKLKQVDRRANAITQKQLAMEAALKKVQAKQIAAESSRLRAEQQIQQFEKKAFNTEAKILAALSRQTAPIDATIAYNLAYEAYKMLPNTETIAAFHDISSSGKSFYQEVYRHEDEVLAVAFSPDQQYVLTGSKDKTAKLWTLDGQLLRTLKGHTGPVHAVAFSPNGKYIATGSADHTIRLWQPTQNFVRTFESHQGAVQAVAFSPDSQCLASGSTDKTIKLWKLNGQVLQSINAHSAAVTDVAFSPNCPPDQDCLIGNGQYILSASEDKTARLWTLDGSLYQTFKGHKGGITAVAFRPNCPDGQRCQDNYPGFMVTGSRDKTARVWTIDGRAIRVYNHHPSDVYDVAFSADGKKVLTSSWELAQIWDLKGKLLKSFSEYKNEILAVAFAPTCPTNTYCPVGNSRYMLTGNVNGVAKLWNLNGSQVQAFEGHQAAVVTVDIEHKGQWLATGSLDGEVRLWNFKGHFQRNWFKKNKKLDQVIFAPNGQSLLAVGGNSAEWWSVKGPLIYTFDSQNIAINSAAFSKDGKKIVLGYSDGSAKIWNEAGEMLKQLCCHSLPVSVVAFEQNQIITGSNDQTARLWSADGNLLDSLDGHAYFITDLDISPDHNSRIVTAGQDRLAKLWNAKGELLQVFEGHEKGITSVTFSPAFPERPDCFWGNGRMILTGSKDRTARFWTLEGQPVHTFKTDAAAITAVAITPSCPTTANCPDGGGQYILTGNTDHRARLIHNPLHSWSPHIYPLSEQEKMQYGI